MNQLDARHEPRRVVPSLPVCHGWRMHEAADLTALDAVDLVTRVHDGLSCAVDVAAAHLARLAEHPGPTPFVAHDRERVMLEAAAVDTRHDRFALPLAGVPVAVAGSIDVSGWATRHGSAALPDEPARRDDELVRRLRGAGAVVIGTTRVAELGVGTCAASAEAVADRLAVLAVGIDGGDGLRVPAAQHGLVAVTPGSGTIPLPAGMDGHWHGLSATGGLARSARDAALLMEVLGAPPASPPRCPARVALSMAVPAPFGRSRRLHADQRAAVIGAAARLRAWPGEAAIVLADPPYPRGLGRRWQRRVRAGVAAHVAALGDDLDPGALGPAAAAVARKGRWARPRPSARTAWRDHVLAWLDDGAFDLLLCPAVPDPLPPGASPLRRTVLTRAWNLAGLPAVVAPVVVGGRPAAVQLVGRPGAEAALLAAAALLERRAVPAAGAAEPRVYA